MKKLLVPFETYPVNPALDPEGGYAMRICDQQILNDDTIYGDTIREETLPISQTLLKLCVEAVMRTTTRKVAEDCRPRRIGDLVKVSPYIRGKVTSPYGSFDAATCSTSVLVTSMKGVSKKVDLSKVQFVNIKTGTKVTIDRISYEGATDQAGLVKKGRMIVLTGLNCQFILDIDSAEIHYSDAEGAEQWFAIVPNYSSVTEMRFDWPSRLDDLPEGSSIELRLKTRAGIEDGEPQPNSKTATVLEADPPEASITKVATTGKDGIVKGQAFEAVGEHLGFNFATDHSSVRWMEGSTPRQAALVPLSATAEKIAFSSCELFDDLEAGTELTFEFEIGDKSIGKTTTVLAE